MPSGKCSSFDTSQVVLVTGGTGYVAGVLIQKLLEMGVTVRTTVRSRAKADYLVAMANDLPGELTVFEADLLKPGSFEESVSGCHVVFHTASPFTTKFRNAQTDLVDPAVQGTTNVLSACNSSPSVRQVVLTSSAAAVYGDAADLEGDCFTEDDWNTTSSVSHNPYNYSKVEAEKTAWRLHKEQSQWKLVVLNPTLVMGPGVRYQTTSQSFKILIQLAGGEARFVGAPKVAMSVVDVRDLAEAHIAAAATGYDGRILVSGADSSFPEFTSILAQDFPDYPIPKFASRIPKTVIATLAPILPEMTRKQIQRNYGIMDVKFSNARSKEVLAMDYVPLRTTLGDMYRQLIDAKAVKPRWF